MSGLGRVYRRKDSRFWWISLPLKGRKPLKESSRSTRREDAEELLKRRIVEFRAAPYIQERATVADVVREYLEDAEMRGTRSLQKLERFGESIVTFCGHELATDITTSRLRDYQVHLHKRGYKPGTVNTRMRNFRAIMRFGEAMGRIARAPISPRSLPGERPRQGFLEHEDYLAIHAELPDWAADIFTFTYFSGWRCRSEVLTLTWNDVDLEGGGSVSPRTTRKRARDASCRSRARSPASSAAVSRFGS